MTTEKRITVPKGLCLYRPTDREGIQDVLDLFSRIAEEEGWQPGDYLKSNPPAAVHIALECDGEAVGGLQAVLPDNAGRLPCHRVWPEVVLPKRTAHVAIIAVAAAHRGRIDSFWALCQDLWLYAADNRIEALSLECTERMLVVYRRLGLPLQVVGELREHWGEPCYLTKVDTVAVAGSVVIKARKSDVFRKMVLDALKEPAPSGMMEAVTLPGAAA